MPTIRKLEAGDVLGHFDCGQGALNRFLKQEAWREQSRNNSTTFVLAEDAFVLGYATITMGTLGRKVLPHAQRRRESPYPLPIMLLARMGVHRDYQRAGCGKQLLAYVFRMLVRHTNDLPIGGLVVDAKPEAVAFYERFGFEHLLDTTAESPHLFLTLEIIRLSFAESGE